VDALRILELGENNAKQSDVPANMSVCKDRQATGFFGEEGLAIKVIARGIFGD